MHWAAGLLICSLISMCGPTGAGRAGHGGGGPGGAPRWLLSTRLEPRPLYLKPCPDKPKTAVRHFNVSYSMQGRTTVVIGLDYDIEREADQYSKVKLHVERCGEAISTNNCVPHKTFESRNACTVIQNPVMPWAKIVASIRPHLDCPAKAGRYELTNGTLTMDYLLTAASHLRLEDDIWRFRVKVFDAADELYLCFEGAGEFIRVRNQPVDPE